MYTKIADFLAEKKRQQENLTKVNENETPSVENTGDAPAAEGAQPTAAEQAVELKALVDEVAAELGLNPATVEGEVESGVVAANEGFIDTITNAISTFGQELGNYEHASFSTGIIIFLILGAATAALWTGVSIADKAKAKKALHAYLSFKYQDQISKLSNEQLKGFIVDKVKELQANKTLMADIAAKSDLYIAKYGKYVKESTSPAEQELVNEFFGIGKKTYKLDDTFKPSPAAADFFAKRKDLVAQYNKFFTKQGMDVDTAAKAIQAVKMFAGEGVPTLSSYTITYDAATKALVIDPNGKGLFNGHPIMG
jgi:hypothetical protein